MATHRYVTTSFWKDSWITTLDPSERYIYIYLLTNPSTNISGVYEITDKEISNDTGYTYEVIKIILDKFAQENKCYRMGKYIVLLNWPKHQNWGKKETIKNGIIKELEMLNDEELILLHLIEYKFPVKDILDKRGIPYPYDTHTIPAILLNSIQSNLIKSNSILNLHEKPEAEQSQKASSEAKASEPEKSVIPVSQSPPEKKSKKQEKQEKQELTEEQLALFHAAKACFESNEITKELLYQDKESTARYMKHIKTLVIRCSNMVPDMSANFLRNVLEHFQVMCNGKLKGKAVAFTPQALMTGWIWEAVIVSLPEAENPELIEVARGLFKK